MPGRCCGRSTRRTPIALAIQALKLVPRRRAAADDVAAGGARLRPEFPQSGRHRRRLRQECRGAGRAAAARLRLRRDRHGDAAAAAGQSAAAVVPARHGRGVINRLGFNNDGAAAVLRAARGARRSATAASSASTSAPTRIRRDRIADYVGLIEPFAPVASYFTVNVSSPNTPGLRDMQHARALDDLLARVLEARDADAPRSGQTPVLLKIAPDLTLGRTRRRRGRCARAQDRRHDRRQHDDRRGRQPCATRDDGEGGGRPVGPAAVPLSTRMLAETIVRAEGAFPLIGVGGIDTGAAALAKITRRRRR